MNSVYDVVVIGAGAVGENAAASAARHGLSVVIVEAELVGGECTYWACMPSKALLNPGRLLEAVRRAPGLDHLEAEIDTGAALSRRDALASRWDDQGQVSWLDGVGVDLQRGWARLAGERLVHVTEPDGDHHEIEATTAVVIATGSAPAFPEIEGLEDADTWDSRDATSADEVPKSLLVIGGGAVGVEMAQAWSWLGSEVTLVQRPDELLANEEPFAGAELRRALERQGVKVITGGDTRRIEELPSGALRADIELSDSEITVTADEILIATGRRARTDDLGLDTIGLKPGEFIEVDRHMRARLVPEGWLYAVGDVNGRAIFTHVGKYEGRIAGSHIGGHETAAVTAIPSIPRVIFTSPEVAAVGMTEAAARDAGIDIATVSYDIGKVAGTSTLGRGYSGTCQLVIDVGRQVVIGATFVGPATAELLHSATIAIVGEVPLSQLWHAVPPFPTGSEIWLRLLEAYRDGGWDPYEA